MTTTPSPGAERPSWERPWAERLAPRLTAVRGLIHDIRVAGQRDDEDDAFSDVQRSPHWEALGEPSGRTPTNTMFAVWLDVLIRMERTPDLIICSLGDEAGAPLDGPGAANGGCP